MSPLDLDAIEAALHEALAESLDTSALQAASVATETDAEQVSATDISAVIETELESESEVPSEVPATDAAEGASQTLYVDSTTETWYPENGIETIIGSGGNDSIDSDNSNDSIFAGAGIDPIDGDAEGDTVFFTENCDGYDMTLAANVYTAPDLYTDYPVETNILTNVEVFRFTDCDLETTVVDPVDEYIDVTLEPIDIESIGPLFETTTGALRLEVIFVDGSTQDAFQLANALLDNSDGTRYFDVILLDVNLDGLEQIGEVLAGYDVRTVDAIHIVSHGYDGAIRLGNDWLTSSSLATQSEIVSAWSPYLTENADILVYGCDVAATEIGQELIEGLSHLTGADVAASIDATGSVTLGGNWTLEYATGQIETGVAASAALQDEWQYVMATYTVLDSFGIVSFSNNYGTANWSTNWVENDTGGTGTTTGWIRVTSGQLRFATESASDWIYRQANLSGASSATLSFTYNNTLNGGPNFTNGIYFQISSNNGTSYTTLETFDNTTNLASGTKSYDISSYISSQVRVRFLCFDPLTDAAIVYLYIDDFQISYFVNEAPTAVSDTATAVEAGGVSNSTAGTNPTGNVLTNDTDPDSGTGDTKTVSGVAAGTVASASTNVGASVTGTFGSINIASNGAYTYTVDNSNATVQALRTTANTLTDVFTYTMRDSAGLTSTTQITVTIQGANDAPITVTDTATAVEAGGTSNGTAGTNPTGNVLTNDTDVDADDTKVVSGVVAGVSASASGSVGASVTGSFGSINIAADGTYTYTVDNSNATVQALRTTANTITDVFTYTMLDTAGLTRTTQISITIEGQNDEQVIATNATTTVAEGSTGNVITSARLLTTDIDDAASNLTYTLNSIPTNGTLRLSGTALTLGQTFTQANINAGLVTYDHDNSQTASDSFNFTVNDGSGTTSSATFNFNITNVNDAPVLDNTGAMTLTSITEDQTTNSGNTVAAIISSAGGDRITDVDSGAVEGMAITALTSGNGTWEYSTNGGSTWTAVGTVSNSSALLLRSTDSLRFVPNGQNSTTADVTFHAWDQTTGSFGTKVDVATNGTTTAFSTASEVASITITAVNDAPVLDNSGTMTLTSITEDQTTNSGNTVASVIASAGGDRITDVDTSAVEGIAITSLNTGYGKWQYSLDGGSSWLDVGAVSNTSALLLRSTDSIRFLPQFENGSNPDFTFRAWDQTTGTAGTKVTTASNGGTTAFSSAIETASIVVSDVNDAPVLDAARTPVLSAINEDAGLPVGAVGSLVSSLIDFQLPSGQVDNAADDDIGAQLGIAITSTSTVNGTWYYSTDNGSNWTVMGSVSDASARLLAADANTRIYFAPATNYNGSISDAITFRAWDRTSGSNGALADTTTNGGTTAFSTVTDIAGLTITSVNDAPVAVADAASATEAGGTSNGSAGTNPTGNVLTNDTDVDASDTKSVTGVSAGVQASAAGSVASSVTGTYGWINIAADGTYIYTVDNSNATVQALRISGQTLTDVFTYTATDTGGLTSTTQITITIQGANDAPTAVADTATAVEAGGAANGTAGTNPTGNVLSNDTDVDAGDTKTVSGVVAGVSASASGSVDTSVTGTFGLINIASDGSYTYTVDNSNATVQALRSSTNTLQDVFTYTMQDAGGLTSTTQISITIQGANDAPVQSAIEITSLTYSESSGAVAITSTLTLADVDDANLASAMVQITGNYSIGQDLLSFTDQNGISGSWDSVAGTLTLTGTATKSQYEAALRSVSYTNTSEFPSTATRTVTFTVNDGSLYSSTVTRAIDVTALNDAPVNTMPGVQSVAVNTTLTLSGANAIQIDDVDAASNNVQVTLTASNGTMTLASVLGLSFTTGDGVNDSTIVITGTLASINAALDGLQFIPTNGYTGTANIALLTEDLGNSGTGGNLSDSDNLAIQVGGMRFQEGVNGYTGTQDTYISSFGTSTDYGNATSVIVDDPWHDGLIRFDNLFGSGAGQIAYGSTITTASLSVYVTGTDAFDDVMVHRMLAAWTEASTWNSVSSGVQANGTEAATSVSYTIDAGVGGWITITGITSTLQAWSDGATNNGWALLGNGADNWSFRSSEYATVSLRPYLTVAFSTPQSADIDLDANNSSGVAGSGAARSWTENGGPVTISDMDATISDTDSSNLQSMSVRISNLLDGTDESLVASTTGTSITASYNSSTGELTLSGSDTVANYQQVLRTVTYNNTSESPSTTSRLITVQASDMFVQSNIATSTITIAAVNDAPVLDNAGTMSLSTITEDQLSNSGNTVSSILASAGGDRVTDVDTGAVEGIAIISLSSGNGTWEFSIDNGSNWLSVGTVAENSALLLRNTDLLRFVPNAENATAATFTFRAWDQTGATSGGQGTKVNIATSGGTTAFSTATEIASITVTAVNDNPIALSDTATGVEAGGTSNGSAGTNPTGNVLINDTDVDAGDTKTVIGVVAGVSASASGSVGTSVTGTFGSINIAADGTYTYTVDNNNATVQALRTSGDTINDVFTYTVRDTAGLTSTTQITVTIEGANDEQVLTTNATATVAEGSTGNVLTSARLLTTDIDDAASNLTYRLDSIPANGVLRLSGTALTLGQTFTQANINAGLITYDHDNSQTSSDAFNFTVNDGSGTTSSATFNFNIMNVNDAPVLDNSGAMTLTTITEDQTTNSGNTVASIIASASDNRVTDDDSGAVEGIALTATTNGNGTWQYSTDGGTTWTAVGTVSNTSALLLRATDSLRFVPNGQNATTGDITFRAWDQTTGIFGNKVDVSTNGGTTAFSTAIEVASITVTAVNDAPTITNAYTHTLTGTNEDTASSGTLASEILAGSTWADVDSSALSGLAITSVTGNGTWQYSTDGTTWTNFGAVSATNALLITSTSQVRYIPDTSNGETATFGFVAWDQTSGTASTNSTPAYANPGAGGSTTAYSSQLATAQIVVTSVNDAPVMDNAGNMTLTSLTEDQTTNSGNTIASIILTAGGDRITDSDIGAVEGIAITATTNGNGSWEYSTDGGSTWNAVGAVTNTSALLLRATDSLRFVPNGQNATSGDITFRAWDQSSGTFGNKVDVSTNGTTTAFSTSTQVASITVTSLNDAPTITNAYTHSLTGTDESTTSPGTLASAILSGSMWADVDTSAVSGLAITSVTGNGTWQYSIDGTTWTNFGAVSGTNALLITSTSQVRYIPDTSNGETATFGYRAWDQTTGTASVDGTPAYATTVSNGGTTAFSSQAATAQIIVSSVNGAPTITNAFVYSLTGTDENTTSSGTLASAILAASSLADLDTGAVSGLAITSTTGNGTWQYSTDGTTWNSFGAVTTANALLITSTTQVRYIPDSANGETATFTYNAWDQTSGTASDNATARFGSTASSGGTTAFSANTGTAQIVVTAINDAPELDNTGVTSLPTITKLQTNNGGVDITTIIDSSGSSRISDVDTGAVEGIAVTSLSSGNGTWQYSTNGGSSWTNIGAVSNSSALLLREIDLVRFVPNGVSGTTASFNFRAWDQSTGTAGAKVDVSTNGGTTAFSSATETASITVIDVNSAPVLDTSKTPTLGSISEDLGAPAGPVGSLVSTLVDFNSPSGQVDNVTDFDSGAGLGIAITSADTTNGTWFYSTDNGTNWNALGSVSISTARLLAADANTRIYFQANTNYHGTLANAITFHAWDQTSGTNGSTASLVASSMVRDEFSFSSYANNNGTVSWATNWIESDTGGGGATGGDVSINGGQLRLNAATVGENIYRSVNLSGAGSATLSFNYNNAGTGPYRWELQISGNGGATYSTYETFTKSSNSGSGTKSIDLSSVISSDTRIRFIVTNANPNDILYVDNVQISYSLTGGISAFSSASDTVSLVINPVADAPSITSATTNEDAQSSSGLVITRNAVDGVEVSHYKITGITSGTLYKNDGVTQIINGSFITIAEGNAGLKFTPTANFNGTANFTLQASTSNSDAGLGGNTVLATVTVNPVNDAPVLDNVGNMTFTSITEDQTASAGNTVASLIASAGGDRITDVDSAAIEGIAITALSSGNGSWEYSTDGGATWTAVGTVSNTSALLLRATDSLRFVPNGQNATTGDVTFRAWDQTSGTFGTKVDTSTNGTTTAFSTSTEVASITVTAVNDTPIAVLDTATAVEAGGTANGTTGTNPTGNVLTNDTDVDSGDTKTVSGVAAGTVGSASTNVGSSVVGAFGSINIAANGTYTYTVDNNNATVQALRTTANTITDVFTYTMTDSGGLNSTTQITVTIQGANDTPTDITAGTLSIAENSANGSAIGTAAGVDIDTGETFTYSLTDNAGGRFAIHSSTGAITVANSSLLNYEAAASHSITVRVTDAGGLTYDKLFTVNLTDVNEFSVTAPTDSNATTNAVDENAANGTAVGITASASDSDGTTNAISYSLVDNAGGRFAINSATGVVTVADGSLLNRETAASHDITVRATSADGSTADTTFAITLNDVDEFDVGVVTDTDAATNAVNENSANGTVVGITGFATDPDATTNAITYTLSDNAGGRFAIDSTTGVVTVADGSLLNREAAASHGITVRATSADGSYSDQTFSIAINDVDEFDVTAPVDTNGTSNRVNENAAIGTAVGITAASSDADATTNAITYSLFDSDGGNFAIDTNTGVVTTVAALNREALGATRSITVRATSADGSTADTVFTIDIIDLDEFDVGALTDTNATANTIAENSANGTLVNITGFAADADATTNAITYSLDDNAGGRFAINSSTGVVAVLDGSLLNYEAATSHNITIRATSADTSFSTQNFTINLTDVNEAAVGAVSDSNAAANYVLENATLGTVVGVTGLATDADGTDVVTYTLDDNAGGRFAIDSNTGVVTVAGAIDREAAASYNITVRATSTDTSSSTQTFTINIGDVNEFATSPVTDANITANSVTENASVGTVVNITGLATDADATTNTITYTLFDNDGSRFAIDSNSGIVTVAGAINREADGASRNITVRATSADGSYSDQIFTIAILDANEFDVTLPTDTDATPNNVNENVAIGTTVGITANAFDLDATTNTITYSLSSNPNGLFQIDATTGVITTATAIDREVVGASRNITVQATSSDGSTASQVFTIAINDLDEFDVTTPSDTDASINQVNENVAIGTTVGITASSFDLDSTTNAVTYNLTSNPDGLFQIDANTGVITTASAIDRELVGAARNITVQATSSDGSTASQVFTIAINDLDEFDVTVPTDTDATSNNVNENVAIGTTVGITANAFDLDATTNTITYSLSSNPNGLFQIDANTGVITTASAIDREVVGASRNITVQATSSDGSTASQVFTIAINDLDEFDVTTPSDTDASINQVNENVAIGTTVGITANAFDLDATTNTVTYSLTSNPDGLFQIDANTGVITTAAAIDREVVGASRNITVQATSSDGSTASQVFTIAINDLDEFDVTVPTDTDATSNNVDENVAIGTTVGITVNAFDLDATTNTITYSLTSNPNGLFQIDATTGVITTATAIDREVVGASRNITVQATSSDGSTASQVFTIAINDLDEFDVTTPSDTDATPNNVNENVAIGTAVGITANAYDLDATNTITYSLTANPNGLFQIDPNTGVVATAAPIDRELVGASRSITVRATSVDGSTADQTFNIQVNDLDEFDVSSPTDTNATANSVNENSAVGTAVGIQVAAYDSDATNSMVTYSLDDSAGGRFQIDSLTGLVRTAQVLDHEFADSHNVTVRATSADGSFMTSSFNIAVNDLNELPVANADTYSTTYADTLRIPAAGLIANDADPDGNALTANLVAGPNSGSLVLNPDGSFTYTPVVPFVGAVTFQYTVTDGQLTSAVQTVTINVTSPVVPPPTDNGGGSGAGSSSGSSSSTGTSTSTTTNSTDATGTPANAPVAPIAGLAEISSADSRANAENAAAASGDENSESTDDNRSTGFSIDADAQGFMFTTDNGTNSVLSTSMLLNDSHSAIARLNAERDARLVQELANTHTVFTRLHIDLHTNSDIQTVPGVQLIAKTAIGSGVVVWVVHVSQVFAALLAASSAWMHIDPLSVLNASKGIIDAKANDAAEALFDNETVTK